MGLKDKLRSAIGHYRKGGWPRVLQGVSRHVPDRLFHLYRVELLRLDRFVPPTLRRSPPYRFAVATDGEIDGIVRALHPEAVSAYRTLFHRFREEGQQCVYATKDGEVAGYYWSFHSMYQLTDDGYRNRILTLRLPTEAVVFGNGFIAEGHRLRGLFPYLVKTAIEWLPPGTQCFTTVDALNEGSLKAHRRLGFEPVMTLSCCSLLRSPDRWAARRDGYRRSLPGRKPIVQLADLLAPARQTYVSVTAGLSR